MVQEFKRLIADQPGFWFFLITVVVVGGPTFLNQMAERYLPGGAQLELAEDVEDKGQQLTKVLSNQKRILEDIAAFRIEFREAMYKIKFDHGGLDLRIARLEAWREFQDKNMRTQNPGRYP